MPQIKDNGGIPSIGATYAILSKREKYVLGVLVQIF